MAPRGRPPGRKAALPTRQQQPDQKQKTPKTPKAVQALKKASAASASRTTPSSAAQEIHVAPSPEDKAKDKQDKPDKKKQRQQAFAVQREPSESPRMEEPKDTPTQTQTRQSTPVAPAETSQLPPDEDAVSDSNSIMITRASPLLAPDATPAPAANGDNSTISLGTGAGTSGRSVPRAARHLAGGGYASPSIDLDAISYRQMIEDIDAYNVDLDFCLSQLAQSDLTPQEMRTLQLRRLDLSHQIRYCQHRKEVLEAQRQLKGGRPLSRTLPPSMRGQLTNGMNGASALGYQVNGVAAAANGVKRTANGVTKKRLLPASPEDRNGTPTTASAAPASASGGPVPFKRPRAVSEMSGQDTISIHSTGSAVGGSGRAGSDDIEMTAVHSHVQPHHHYPYLGGDADDVNSDDAAGSPSSSLQRLGFWKCRLCLSEKYLMAGPGRQPNAPSKWPLKDMGKLMSHYFDMHTEHEPDERCAELGDALDRNRGPFEYWLRKSRAQKITDRTVIDQMIEELQDGRVPKMLRDLCRAAAAFPGA